MKVPAPANEQATIAEPRSERLNVAALRRAVTIRTWGGKGCGAACDFCRVIIAPTDVEYEVDARLDGAIVMLHFHRRCHEAWKTGREPGDLPPPEGPPPSAA